MEKTSISIISLEFHKPPREVSNVIIVNREPRKLKFREASHVIRRTEIKETYSMEGMMLKLKLQYFGRLM